MATLTIDTTRILANIGKLVDFLEPRKMETTIITKMLNGNKQVLEKILCDPIIKRVHSVGDSRISNLRAIKEVKKDIVTMYIKPPAHGQTKNVIKYADISLNSSFETISELNDEAKKQNKKHRVVVMVELGELREGIMRENILKFYESVFNFSNIDIIGLGSNLGCMYGVEPSYDKLIQLNLYKLLIEEKFNKKLELISAGSSITLPLISKNRIPPGLNHFRIGETAFLGVSPWDNKRFKNLSTNAFSFSAEIIELEKKSMTPDGIIRDASIGHTANEPDAEIETLNESYRALVDFGAIDVEYNNLTPKDKAIKFFGITSDMTVYDLGPEKMKYNVGDLIHFSPNYMAVARLMNSKYISKKIL